MLKKNKKIKLAIIGLGYVGLPLALEFAKKRSVIGFDIDEARIKELNSGFDRNFEFSKEELKNSKTLKTVIFTLFKSLCAISSKHTFSRAILLY